MNINEKELFKIIKSNIQTHRLFDLGVITKLDQGVNSPAKLTQSSRTSTTFLKDTTTPDMLYNRLNLMWMTVFTNTILNSCIGTENPNTYELEELYKYGEPNIKALFMHSTVYRNIPQSGLVVFKSRGDTKISYPTIHGVELMIDDNCPVDKVYALKQGSFKYEEVVDETEPLITKVFEGEEIIIRKDIILDVVGCDYKGPLSEITTQDHIKEPNNWTGKSKNITVYRV